MGIFFYLEMKFFEYDIGLQFQKAWLWLVQFIRFFGKRPGDPDVRQNEGGQQGFFFNLEAEIDYKKFFYGKFAFTKPYVFEMDHIVTRMQNSTSDASQM